MDAVSVKEVYVVDGCVSDFDMEKWSRWCRTLFFTE